MQTRTSLWSATSVCLVSGRPRVCRCLHWRWRKRLSVRRFSRWPAPGTVRCSNICWPSCTTLRCMARFAGSAVPPILGSTVPNHRRRCSSVRRRSCLRWRRRRRRKNKQKNNHGLTRRIRT